MSVPTIEDLDRLDQLSRTVWPDELGSMSGQTFEWTRINESVVFKAAKDWLDGTTGHYALFREFARLYSKINKTK